MLLLLAEEGLESSETVNPIVPDIGEMFWGGLMFTLLYFMIRYVLLPPVTKVMEERTARIKGDLDAAEAAKAKTARLSHDLDDQLADVKAEAAAMLEQARTEAAAERAAVISQAEREVQTLKEATRNELEVERSKAMKALRPEVVKMSVSAAQKVLDRNIDPAKAKPVFESKLGNLS